MPRAELYSNSRSQTTNPQVRAVYVHVPFCHTICGYCDFYSEVFDRRLADPLVDALLQELNGHPPAAFENVDSIFFGGGTPTTLAAPALERLLSAFRAVVPPTSTIEFTCEANPATVTEETAAALVAAGVNRVSVGAQSFDRNELNVLDRLHDPAQVAETVGICRAAGLDNVNLDLIFAIPGQSRASWEQNLDAALALQPDHLSCYGLTYEPGTPLHERLEAGGIERVDEDLEAEMFQFTIAHLARQGFAQYEISNFARAGRACRHNLHYWQHDGYIGIGPSASGFVDGVRYKNIADTRTYAEALRAGRSPRLEQERVPRVQQARDAMLLGLRLTVGVERERFQSMFGSDPVDMFPEIIGQHVDAGLLDVGPDHIRLTDRGLLLADHVIADFL